MSMKKMDISHIFSKARNSLGFSQRKLAEKLHISNATISSWERGEQKPSYEALLFLVESSVRPEYLFTGEEPILAADEKQESPHETKPNDRLLSLYEKIEEERDRAQAHKVQFYELARISADLAEELQKADPSAYQEVLGRYESLSFDADLEDMIRVREILRQSKTQEKRGKKPA